MDAKTADRLLRVRARFEAARQPFWGLGGPVREAGELGLVRVGQVARRRLTLDERTLGVNVYAGYDDGRGRLRVEGGLYVTTKRLVLCGNRRKLLAQWPLAELSDVRLLPDNAGLRLVRPGDVSDSDALVVVRNLLVLMRPSEAVIRAQLLAAQAAWVLATGRDFDQWLSAVAGR